MSDLTPRQAGQNDQRAKRGRAHSSRPLWGLPPSSGRLLDSLRSLVRRSVPTVKPTAIGRVTVTPALVVLVAAGCGATPASSAFEAVPLGTAAPETTVLPPATTAPLVASTAPLPAITAPAPATTAPVPKVTTLIRTAPTPRPIPLASLQGSDPVAWTGAFCGGIADVIAGVSALSKLPPIPQGEKDALLAFSDMAQQAFANTAHKLTQLGTPRITDGKQVQDIAVGFFTTSAAVVADQRPKLVALDANDPDFLLKVSNVSSTDLASATSAQVQGISSNKELMPAFRAAPECQRLSSAMGH